MNSSNKYQLTPMDRATVPHAQSTIALYTQLDAERDQQSYPPPSSPGAVNTKPRPLSLFISHSPTVRVPWRNFQSPELGAKFQTALPLICEIP